MKTSRDDIRPYQTRDGSLIRELMHPGTQDRGRLSLAEAEIDPGKATKIHRHLVAEEIYHVTQGEGLMTLGTEQFVISPGDTILIHPGTAHRVENRGKAVLRILCCCAPPYTHSDTEIL